MNKEEITEILDKLSNRKQETLLQGLRECQLKNIEHVFITREEYIDKVLNYINDLQQENQKYKEVIDKAIEYINHFSKESEVKIYGLPKCKVFIGDIEQLLEILNEVSE